MYSRTLPQLLIRKTRPCLALHPPMVMGRFACLAASVVYKSTLPALLVRKLHPPMVIDRFAYLAALVVYKSTLPALLVRKVLFLLCTAFADGNGSFCLPRRFGRVCLVDGKISTEINTVFNKVLRFS